MGLIAEIISSVFGGGRNVVKETVEVFRPNAEADALRAASQSHAALAQYAAEFQHERRGLFDRFIDGLNRLPRPFMAFGVVGLFVAAMTDPLWFSERMAGLALVPEPLWWLLGVIVSFYFGSRYQAKSQDFQKSIAATVAMAPKVVQTIQNIRKISHATPGIAAAKDDADVMLSATKPDKNAAITDWSASAGR